MLIFPQFINQPTIALESEHQWVHHGLCEKIGNAAVVSGKELSGARTALSKGQEEGEEEEDGGEILMKRRRGGGRRPLKKEDDYGGWMPPFFILPSLSLRRPASPSQPSSPF